MKVENRYALTCTSTDKEHIRALVWVDQAYIFCASLT